jgi:hypothetical protein
MVKARINSFHARLYMSSYNASHYDLPAQLCGYFWKCVLAFVLMIPAYPGLIWNHYRKEERFEAIWMSLHVPAAMLVGTIPQAITDKHPHYTLYGVYLWGMLEFIGIFILLVIIGIIHVGIKEYTQRRRWIKFYTLQRKNPERLANEIWKDVDGTNSSSNRPSNLAIEWLKAFKGKYCPKLEWRE